MKTILCYGDSLTFGAIPVAGGGRHAYEDRWPSRLELGLAGIARVIAEGLNGRTTMFDDYTAPFERNGARQLPAVLSTHTPLDVVVIMLGTNDLKPFLGGTALGAAAGLRRLAQIVRTHPYENGDAAPKLVLVAPPLCGPSDNPGGLPAMDRSIAESEKIAGLYRQIATDSGAAFFDAASVARPSRYDGIHLDAANTRAIGDALVPVVRAVLEA